MTVTEAYRLYHEQQQAQNRPAASPFPQGGTGAPLPAPNTGVGGDSFEPVNSLSLLHPGDKDTYDPIRDMTGVPRRFQNAILAQRIQAQRAQAAADERGGMFPRLLRELEQARVDAKEANEARMGRIRRSREADVNNLMDLGAAERSDIDRRFTREQGLARQNLISRGLSASTLDPMIHAGIERQRSDAHSRLRDYLNREMFNFGEAGRTMEFNMNETGPSMEFIANFASGFGGSGFGQPLAQAPVRSSGNTRQTNFSRAVSNSMLSKRGRGVRFEDLREAQRARR